MTSEEAYGASDALAAVDAATRRVAGEVGLPRWYWWGMGAGWVVLGALSDVAPPWVTMLATLVFGAGHSTIASRLLDGRRGTSGLQVRADVAGRGVTVTVIGILLAFVVLGICAAFALDADGAGHPAAWAGLLVGLLAALGGPELLRWLLPRVRR